MPCLLILAKLVYVTEESDLASVLQSYPQYRKCHHRPLVTGLELFGLLLGSIFQQHQQGETTIDDAFYEREVMLNELAFEGQFNYSCFYSFVKLKEQEIRNLVWMCECIIQMQKDRISDHFVPIFSRDVDYRRS